MIRVLAFTLLVATASPALAQNQKAPPEPAPLGTVNVYQLSDQYRYPTQIYYPTYTNSNPNLVVYNPLPTVAYSSPYPFGSVTPVFGLYSWDYGVYYPTAYGWYPYSIVVYPSVYQFPLPPGRVWLR
jgi:hypothetical protein